jgi:hypothetical protein
LAISLLAFQTWARPGVVPRLLEERQRRACERVDLVGHRIGRKLHSLASSDQAGERLAGGVAGLSRSSSRRFGDRRRLLGICGESLREIELQMDVEAPGTG